MGRFRAYDIMLLPMIVWSFAFWPKIDIKEIKRTMGNRSATFSVINLHAIHIYALKTCVSS